MPELGPYGSRRGEVRKSLPYRDFAPGAFSGFKGARWSFAFFSKGSSTATSRTAGTYTEVDIPFD
jgi:hypothetical protein